MDAAKDALTAIVLDPKYHDVLALVKGFRNGIVYGWKVRFPHALVMTFLFRSQKYALSVLSLHPPAPLSMLHTVRWARTSSSSLTPAARTRSTSAALCLSTSRSCCCKSTSMPRSSATTRSWPASSAATLSLASTRRSTTRYVGTAMWW